jgi:hypothetical protein
MDHPGTLRYILAIIGSGPETKESQMASLFFTCPTTHERAPTGIETNVQSLQAAWKATLNARTAARCTKFQCARRISTVPCQTLRIDCA